MNLGEGRLAPAPGTDGLVSRSPGAVLFVGARTPVADVSRLVQTVSGDEDPRPGLHLARRVAALLGAEDAELPPFALVAASPAGVYVRAYGAVEVRLTADAGEEVVSGVGSVMGVDRELAGPFHTIVAHRAGDPAPAPVYDVDLRAGTTTGSGFSLTTLTSPTSAGIPDVPPSMEPGSGPGVPSVIGADLTPAPPIVEEPVVAPVAAESLVEPPAAMVDEAPEVPVADSAGAGVPVPGGDPSESTTAWTTSEYRAATEPEAPQPETDWGSAAATTAAATTEEPAGVAPEEAPEAGWGTPAATETSWAAPEPAAPEAEVPEDASGGGWGAAAAGVAGGAAALGAAAVGHDWGTAPQPAEPEWGAPAPGPDEPAWGSADSDATTAPPAQEWTATPVAETPLPPLEEPTATPPPAYEPPTEATPAYGTGVPAGGEATLPPTALSDVAAGAPIAAAGFTSQLLGALDPEEAEAREALPIELDPAEVRAPEQSTREVIVQGVVCSRGHFNDPRSRFCSSCGISMVQNTQVLTRGPRPPLGVMVFEDGSTFSLSMDYVVGRQPEVSDLVRDGLAMGLPVDDPERSISRAHAELRLVEWDVHLVNLSQTNGSFVWDEGAEQWVTIPPGQSVMLTPGMRIALGRRSAVFESSLVR